MPQSAEESNLDDAKVIGAKVNGVHKGEVEDTDVVEKDDFGLPIRKRVVVESEGGDNASTEEEDESEGVKEVNRHAVEAKDSKIMAEDEESESEDEFKDARSTPN